MIYQDEINEDTHFKDTSRDSLGFSRNEMDKLAEKAGFTLFASKQLYKNISIFNKKISTFYLADKIGPFWV